MTITLPPDGRLFLGVNDILRVAVKSPTILLDDSKDATVIVAATKDIEPEDLLAFTEPL